MRKNCLISKIIQSTALLIAVQISVSTAQANEKEWTFLTYLNGNNNLDSFGKKNIKQMEQVGSTADINVVVQWASMAAKGTKRYYITKSTNPNAVTSPAIDDLKDADMGDWKTLVEFIRWGVTNFPAKHYFINVWDHGSGWHLLNVRNARPQLTPMDISWDDHTGHSISTENLALAMSQAAQIIGHKVDLYGSDACLMAMIEVADEMSDSVSIFAGSEETEPADGWPYNKFLERWAEKPQSTAKEVGTFLTEETIQAYSGGQYGRKSATFSALDLSKLETLKAQISLLGQNFLSLATEDQTTIADLVGGSQSYAYSDYVDLGDFISRVNKKNLTNMTKSIMQDIHTVLKQVVVASQATPDLKRSTGVSIWIPGSKSNYDLHVSRYQKLKFDKDTHWSKALEALLPAD